MIHAKHFYCAGLLVLLAGSTARGQMTPPQCYMWERSPTSSWIHDTNFIPMVRVYVDGLDGTAAANVVTAEIAARLTAGDLDRTHVAILLQNYAQDWTDGSGTHDTYSLLTTADALSISNWSDSDDFPSQDPRRQPWMTSGISTLTTWMNAFTTQFKTTYPPTALNPVIPARFHFDYEISITNLGSTNYAQTVKVLSTDPRYTSTIPGTGTSLSALWTAATNTSTGFGWTGTLDSQMNTSFTPQHVRNQMYMLWFGRIAQQALDGALATSTYTPIWNAWPGSGVSPVKVSNYGHSRIGASNTEDTFGWFHAYDASSETTVIQTRNCVRGSWDVGEHGVHPSFVRSTYDSSTNPSGNNALVGRWLIYPGARSGNTDAPELYHWPAQTGKDCRQENMYLPFTTGTTHPTETQWEASLRLQRMAVESIINSNLSSSNLHPEDSITPWIPIIGCTPYLANAALSESECRDQLAMLYAKKIPELLVWGSNTYGSSAHWSAFKTVYNSVYGVYICGNVCVGPGDLIDATTADPDTLKDTLRVLEGGSQVENLTEISSEAVDDVHVTAMKVGFCGLRDSGGGIRGNRMRVYVECQVDIDESSSPDPYCVGAVYAKLGSGWVLLQPSDFHYTDPRYHYYGMFTPDQYTRRTFDFYLDPLYVDSAGKIVLKFVHVSLPVSSPSHASTAFTSKYDLLQVVPYFVPDVIEPGGGESLVGGGGSGGDLGSRAGADYNFDGQITEGDADAFLADYANCRPAADYNDDGSIDASDVSDFVTDYLGDAG